MTTKQPNSLDKEPESVPLKESTVKTTDSVEVTRGVISEEPSLQKTGWRRYIGLTCALLSSLFFSLTVLLVKILSQNHGHHPFVLTMWRYGGILVPAVPIAVYFQKWEGVQVFETLRPLNHVETWKNLLIYLMQGILGCTATILRFISIQYISIGDSTVVFSASTVLITILAHFFLKEKCGVVSLILAFFTAIGVMIIARPPIITGESEFNLSYLTGTMYAVLALLCAAHFLILMRKIRKTHFSLMMLVGGSWGVLESGTLAVILGVFTLPRSLPDLALIVALSALTFLGQSCIIIAIKYENAGPLSIGRTTESIFAFLWQFLFLGIAPDYISVVGGAVVLTAVVITGYCKYLASLPNDDPLRKKLIFLLR